MAALYIIPELFKSKKSKEYEYPEIPEIPDPTDIPQKPKPKMQSVPASTNKDLAYQYSKAIKATGSVHLNNYPLPPKVSNSEAAAPTQALVEKQNEQKAQIDQAVILNGIIWAEVLLPPRAHRPLAAIRPKSNF